MRALESTSTYIRTLHGDNNTLKNKISWQTKDTMTKFHE